MKTTFGPYSPIKQASDLYFVSGQVGMNKATKHAPKDVKSQTSQALVNMQTILEDNDLSMDDVVKTTIFLTNMGDFAAVNEVYEGFFAAPRPARSTVAVKELPRLASSALLVEIEAVAYKS